MKKLLFLFAVLSIAFVSCDNDTEDTQPEQTAEATTEDENLNSDLIHNPNTASETTDNSGAAPVMKFEKMEHDFGKVKQGEVVETEFTFTNTGNADLIISNASAECGCTVPTYPKHPIKPGETATIPVQYNSAGKSNLQKKNITLTANTNPSQTILTIQAFVEAQ